MGASLRETEENPSIFGYAYKRQENLIILKDKIVRK